VKHGFVHSEISPSPHPEAEPGIEEWKRVLAEEPPARCCREALKEQCLRRDRFRCVITGAFDLPSLERGRTAADNHFMTDTECVPIIPFGLRVLDNDDEIEVLGCVPTLGCRVDWMEKILTFIVVLG